MESVKKQFVLEGLCCGNCAAKIQRDIASLSGVKTAKIDVDTAILDVEADTYIDGNDIVRIALIHDEDILVKEIQA